MQYPHLVLLHFVNNQAGYESRRGSKVSQIFSRCGFAVHIKGKFHDRALREPPALTVTAQPPLGPPLTLPVAKTPLRPTTVGPVSSSQPLCRGPHQDSLGLQADTSAQPHLVLFLSPGWCSMPGSAPGLPCSGVGWALAGGLALSAPGKPLQPPGGLCSSWCPDTPLLREGCASDKSCVRSDKGTNYVFPSMCSEQGN